MKRLNFKTDIKFKFSIVIISLLMLILVLSSQFTDKNFYIVTTVIGVLSLIAIIISVIGLLRSIKNLKQPTSKRRIASIIVIAFVTCLFFYLIVANIIEVLKHVT
ncbi:hypothetical protein [Polaribacter dokdonensis]|uniref:Uncharacterized protein n=1 Tax=Polaribacter dokdonensis DSW-5 TaxID=1300348 RepID=A0A0M9CHM0_9FLAO|nr:hypothetical protein [Polaribacter dokdonensis]KOY52801.1 hypothetical protein I602_2361 [Polaribacter dokdonensis DSW-5]SEE52567.1 hypothetical protein SAMN05444353_2136 [Polaribacter dokdonensis DSW-5]